MADEGGDEAQLRAAMARLADRAALERTEAQIPRLVELLSHAGAPPIVLKGPVTRHRLYRPDEARPTADVDLLVDPRAFGRAGRALTAEGFARVLVAGHSDSFAGHEGEVDLHIALPFTTVAPRRAFEALSRHVVTMEVGGRHIPVLDEPAHVVHLAVHAAQNDFDPAQRSLDEWRRGWTSLSATQVRDATAVADEIGASVAWDLARRALAQPMSGPDLAPLLPARRPGATLRSVWSFLRSPIPLRVRWRALRTPVHDQLSDDVVNAWRTKHGLVPLPSGTLAIRWAKVARLVTATAITVRRGEADGRPARRRPGGAPPPT